MLITIGANGLLLPPTSTAVPLSALPISSTSSDASSNRESFLVWVGAVTVPDIALVPVCGCIGGSSENGAAPDDGGPFDIGGMMKLVDSVVVVVVVVDRDEPYGGAIFLLRLIDVKCCSTAG